MHLFLFGSALFKFALWQYEVHQAFGAKEVVDVWPPAPNLHNLPSRPKFTVASSVKQTQAIQFVFRFSLVGEDVCFFTSMKCRFF